MAVNDLAPGTPLVLRLGDGDVAAETDSLLHLGAICDVHDVVAGEIAREIITFGQPLASAPSPGADPPKPGRRSTET